MQRCDWLLASGDDTQPALAFCDFAGNRVYQHSDQEDDLTAETVSFISRVNKNCPATKTSSFTSRMMKNDPAAQTVSFTVRTVDSTALHADYPPFDCIY